MSCRLSSVLSRPVHRHAFTRICLYAGLALLTLGHANAQSLSANPAPNPAPKPGSPPSPLAPLPSLPGSGPGGAAVIPPANPSMPPPAAAPTPAPSSAVPTLPGAPAIELPNFELMPSDFLDSVQQQAKARWRSLYAPTSLAAPPTDRLRVAFTLGNLIAESYLALQASDSQHFRNINQDIQKYCNSLALADKVTPLLMAGSKMAESEDWTTLRDRLEETQKLIEKLLRDQRDEDLALLVRLGMWFRLFEITTTIIQGEPSVQNKTLCIGSLPLLDDLNLSFEKLSAAARAENAIALIGNTLQLLQKHWAATESANTPQDTVDMTLEKVRFLIGKLTLKGQPGSP